MNVKPPTKVRQYSHIKADATSVMNKSFEKLLSNNFQVIIFERMAKNYFKMNILYKIYWNLCFPYKYNNILLSKHISCRPYISNYYYLLLFFLALIN